jgi:hypothetical protein
VPPDVLVPVKVTERECIEVAQSQLLTTEDQRQVRVLMGSTINYKYVESGSVTMSETNVACEGGEIKIQGQKHDNLLKLVTVAFTITEIDIWEKKNWLRVEEGMLPRFCSLATEGCALEDFTITIDLGKVNLCPYGQIRVVPMEVFTYQGKFMLISDEHKLLVEVKEKVPIPAECVVSGKLIKTNFDRLFLYQGELGQNVDLIDPATLDLELESRVVDFYMSMWALGLVRESEAKWQTEVCSLTAGRMHEDQVVLHGDHVLRLQGELILEFPCEKTRVRTRLGMKPSEDICYDHLPVFTADNMLEFMAPITRMLVSKSAVSVINCSTHYPLLFEDITGQMITANPEVRRVEVKLNNYHHLDATSGNHSELFTFSSLLYTKEEIAAYQEMIMGNGAEKIRCVLLFNNRRV